MNALAICAAALLAGCAMAIGDRSTVCVEINSRTGLVIDPAASAAAGSDRQVEDPAGMYCRSGG